MSDSTTTGTAEPSMEEILASIRQIINQNDKPEEGAAELPAAAEEAPLELAADTAPEDDDIFELTNILEETAPTSEPVVAAAPAPAAPEPMEPVAPVAEASFVPPIPPSFGNMPADTLITGTTAAAATAALAGLASTLHQERAEHSLPLGNHSRTLESMVVEAIKPLLKEWLDENLPAIVERVVTAEVEKLTKRLGG